MQRQQLEALLLAKQNELTTRVEKIHADISKRHISKKFSDQAVERENDDVLRALDLEAQSELTQIDRALERLKTDAFDRCISCQETISDERLTAIPFTNRCRHCVGNE